jgi:hypothetical protein
LVFGSVTTASLTKDTLLFRLLLSGSSVHELAPTVDDGSSVHELAPTVDDGSSVHELAPTVDDGSSVQELVPTATVEDGSVVDVDPEVSDTSKIVDVSLSS